MTRSLSARGRDRNWGTSSVKDIGNLRARAVGGAWRADDSRDPLQDYLFQSPPSGHTRMTPVIHPRTSATPRASPLTPEEANGDPAGSDDSPLPPAREEERYGGRTAHLRR